MISCAVIKIALPTDEVLLETMQQYSWSAQQVVDAGYGSRMGKLKLHHQTYYPIREALPKLPAQLVCSSRDKAYESLKAVRERGKKGWKISKPQMKKFLTVRYDARTFSLKDDVVSLSTVEGRRRFNISIPKYFQQYIGWKHCTADLLYRKGRLYLHVVVSTDVRIDSSTGNFVGVDVGINNLAVTSEGKFFSGIKEKYAKILRLTKRLQAQGTRSAKRKLKRVSGRRKRFMADVNHRISKEITSDLNSGDCIVLEELTNIRERCTVKSKNGRGKVLNRLLNNWSFNQLQSFLDYKAVRKGVWVVYVNPAYTSKSCSHCGSRYSVRPQKRGFFKCLHCGYSLNADLNASRNIRERVKPLVNARGLYVNQPIVACDEGETPSLEGGLSPNIVTSPHPLGVGS